MSSVPAELHCAVAFKNFDAVICIVNSGVALDDLWRGKTAVSYAVYVKDYRILEYLVNKGANVNICSRDDKMEPPLFAACRLGLLNAVKILLKSANIDVNQKDFFNHTPLWAAAKINSTTIVELLLNNGADALTAQRLFECPIIQAMKKPHSTLTHLLIQRGCRVHFNLAPPNMITPLHKAVQQADLKTFILLINAGCPVRKTDKWLAQDQLPDCWKKDQQLCAWIKSLQTSPRTLFHLTSCCIRNVLIKCYKNIFLKHVQELRIPKELVMKLVFLIND